MGCARPGTRAPWRCEAKRRARERGGVWRREERGGVRAARGEEKERRELVTVEPWPHGVYLFGVFYFLLA